MIQIQAREKRKHVAPHSPSGRLCAVSVSAVISPTLCSRMSADCQTKHNTLELYGVTRSAKIGVRAKIPFLRKGLWRDFAISGSNKEIRHKARMSKQKPTTSFLEQIEEMVKSGFLARKGEIEQRRTCEGWKTEEFEGSAYLVLLGLVQDIRAETPRNSNDNNPRDTACKCLRKPGEQGGQSLDEYNWTHLKSGA